MITACRSRVVRACGCVFWHELKDGKWVHTFDFCALHRVPR